MKDLKLNLGCGQRPLAGYVNVDKTGTPDVVCDLETFPWPWPDDSVSEIVLSHVLQHIGRHPNVYLNIMKEMYRVCQADARILIDVVHFRSDAFRHDPTHVRPVTPESFLLFSKKVNHDFLSRGGANSPLALHLDVDFELTNANLIPSKHWFRLYPDPVVDLDLLLENSKFFNNLIDECAIELRVIKRMA